MDIYSRLLKDRIIIIGSEIDPHNQVANAVIGQLLFLQSWLSSIVILFLHAMAICLAFVGSLTMA